MAKTETLEGWLAAGPFTLALSSSFFGFFAHCGFVTALYERGLKPAKLTGSSAGALIGGALASGLSPEETRETLFSMRREDFWDPGVGFGYLKGRKFRKLLEDRFVAEFGQAKIPLEVAAFDLLSLRTRFLSEGSLPAAVTASCAVPLLFHPVRIGGRFLIDGGVFHKSGVNLRHDERILCVLLETDGWMGFYEGGARSGCRVLRFKSLPQVRPDRLETGPEAFTAAYERSLRALKAPATSLAQDA